MSRRRPHRPPTSRPARPLSPRRLEELEALRAELLERYDFIQAQRQRALAHACDPGADPD